jgi:type VI secretion system secreted protein Hcp
VAITYLLEIDGISGDSQLRGHEGAIEVLSWSWGVSRPERPGGGSAGGGGAGRAEFDELQVVTTISSASPELVESCATGRHHGGAVLVGLKQGNRPLEFLRYELGDVTVTNVEHSDDGDDRPVEHLALAYDEFSIAFTAESADGSAGRQTSFTHP